MRDRPSRPTGPRRRAKSSVSALPSVTRPAARRSGASGPGATTTRTFATRNQGKFTGRAVVLGVVLLALAMSYVYPLRVYLAQQAEIAELRAAQVEQRAHVTELAAEAALWEDEDYIRIQARKRLYLGEPGELLLRVVWEDADIPPPTGFDPDDVPVQPGPWWGTLWSSVQAANGPVPGVEGGPGGELVDDESQDGPDSQTESEQ